MWVFIFRQGCQYFMALIRINLGLDRCTAILIIAELPLLLFYGNS